jgi:peptide/nickel transport system ATP-binding protein
MEAAGGRAAAGSGPDGPVVSVRNLTVSFVGSGRPVAAVRGVDFDVFANEVLGIVGESGSGKSVTALAISALLPDTARAAGSVVVDGTEVITAPPERLRHLRGDDVGFVFQDPATTLNPVLPVGRQITEGPVAHGTLPAAQARSRAVELLRQVDIADPAGRARQYPHQFSGGMRQRAVIAMAMAGSPKLIIADEPTTALDVTVQAQVLSLLARRQAETGAAVILITHDLGVVAEVAHRVAVMYAGRIVETGAVADVLERPIHPYTAGLIGSVPSRNVRGAPLAQIPGMTPSLARLPPGCPFSPRCPRATVTCRTVMPEATSYAGGRSARCHHPLTGETPLAA